jgi:hypothetical protein
METLASTFAPGIELPSPLFGTFVFKGADDVRELFTAVYDLLGEVTWESPIGTDAPRVAMEHARVAGLRIDNAMHFDLDREGRILRMRPHLRPLLAVLVFAALIGPRMARHPGVVLRAIRRS